MEYFNVSSMVRSTVNNNKPKKILHIITGLGNGGAEGVLSRLCLFDDSSKHIVISLMGDGKYGPILRGGGVEVICLGLGQSRFGLRAFLNLIKIIKKKQPDVVQTWMYHADFIGGIAARLAGIKNIFWGIRHSKLEVEKTKNTTIIIAKLCALLSRFLPKKIICCAEVALQEHIKNGYYEKKMVVVNNGYDLSAFYCFPQKPQLLKREYGLSDGSLLIGMVGRFTPEKDHRNLFEAFKRINSEGRPIYLILAGTGMNLENSALVSLVNQYGIKDKVILLGPVLDVPNLMNQLDLHILSSCSEGFPNVIAEAMACGVPCVTTDVGDAAFIVGETGWVVPIKNPSRLSTSLEQAIDEMVEKPICWLDRAVRARKRIECNFKLDSMVKKYNEVWRS